MERRVRLLRMEARHRSPQNAGVDLADIRSAIMASADKSRRVSTIN